MTDVALGIASEADPAAVMNDLVGEADPAVTRQNLHQFPFDFFGRVGFGELKAARDAEDVGVDDDAFRFLE